MQYVDDINLIGLRVVIILLTVSFIVMHVACSITVNLMINSNSGGITTRIKNRKTLRGDELKIAWFLLISKQLTKMVLLMILK